MGTRAMNWIKFTRESFATDEDWECVCAEVGADPETAESVVIYISKATIEDKQ